MKIDSHPSPFNRLAFGLLCLTALLITWNGVTLAGRKPADWIIIATFAVVVFYVVIERPSVLLPAWLVTGGVALAASALVTVVWPAGVALTSSPIQSQLQGAVTSVMQTPHSNIGNLLRLEDVFLAIPIVVALLATTRRRCRLLADLWAFSAIASAVVALTDQAGITHVSV